MKELTQFASIRASALVWFHRVLIVHLEGHSPSTGSIQILRNYVTIVDV